MSAPACTDCGAEMQYVQRMWRPVWRCPWASMERWGQAKVAGATVVTCEWPLTTPRQVIGLPNEGVTLK